MIELFLTDFLTGALIAIVFQLTFYITGVIHDLSRNYFSTRTTVPAV